MFSRRKLLGGLAGATAALVPFVVHAQDRAEPAAASIVIADQLNAFGPEAESLSRRTGLWDVEETAWSGPDSDPQTSRGLVADRTMIGSLIQETLWSDHGAVGARAVRTDMLAYNRLDGRWGYMSFDARAPDGIMTATSIAGDDRNAVAFEFAPFAVVAEADRPIGQLVRMDQVYRIVSETRDVKEQYFTMADGSGRRWLGHRYVYTRR